MKYNFCDTCSIKKIESLQVSLFSPKSDGLIDKQSQVRTSRFCFGFFVLHVQNIHQGDQTGRSACHLRLRLILFTDSCYWLSQCCWCCLSNKLIGGTEMTHFTFLKCLLTKSLKVHPHREEEDIIAMVTTFTTDAFRWSLEGHLGSEMHEKNRKISVLMFVHRLVCVRVSAY